MIRLNSPVLSGFLVLTLLSACSPFRFAPHEVRNFATSRNHHSGFVLYDPERKKTLAEVNGDRYFTPASNTKILTLYAGLTLLGDSVPALRYRINGDSLVFSGTGDPSFLNPDSWTSGAVLKLLSGFGGRLYMAPPDAVAGHFGPGWAWDDFDSYYQPERSALPIYGNTIRVKGGTVVPSIFRDSVRMGLTAFGPFSREMNRNRFTLDPDRIRPQTIPFRVFPDTPARLLADTLNRPVVMLDKPLRGPTRILKSVPADSLYKTMMQVSDNFIAEQIMMMASMTISDTLDPQPAIRQLLANDFKALPQRPVWVDGSGLSRYNQITPSSIVGIWEMLYKKIPRERLFPMLAATGRTGTMQNGFGGKPPFIFGKTGTLSNNYSLSGFLITAKGRLLIFSSMNANFTVPVRTIRADLEKILIRIHDEN